MAGMAFCMMASILTQIARPKQHGGLDGRRAVRPRATGNGVRLDEVEDRFVSRLLKNCRPPEKSASIAESQKIKTAVQKCFWGIKGEAFRFTDISPILKAPVKKADLTGAVEDNVIEDLSLKADGKNRVVMLNGVIQWKLTSLEADLKECIQHTQQAAAPSELGMQSSVRGGPFATLNGALFTDALCIDVPKDVKMYEIPVGETESVHVTAPRLFVKCESGSRLEVVEEFLPLDAASSAHLSLPVCEIELKENAEFLHRYVQLDGPAAYHMKTTLVHQSERSSYHLVESNIGGQLSRHDLSIEQGGDETKTEMYHFHLSGDAQLHDLHSKVTLDHVSGVVNQLHKCIVTSASGSGVFDGNVQVNRHAQKTDAGQLSRNLLLAPKATVNVKPNLQIVADDVKCTHGCTVSDLSDEEVFYFRARGIDLEAARRALVYSFGSEINQKLNSEALRQRVEEAVLKTLHLL